MSTAVAENTTNEYVRVLERQLRSAEYPHIDCMVIAHGDNRIIHHVVGAVDSETIAVLPLNQINWLENLPQIVRWATGRGVEHVVIVGHSKTTEPVPQPQILHRGEPAKTESFAPFENILFGTCSAEARLMQSQEQFASSIRNLVESLLFQDAASGDSFRLTLLFYVAHSDCFFRFDSDSETFIPLRPGEIPDLSTK